MRQILIFNYTKNITYSEYFTILEYLDCFIFLVLFTYYDKQNPLKREEGPGQVTLPGYAVFF